MIKLGVLGSTKGTDLEKIIETEKLGQLNATISVVISNRKNAYILERAKTYNIPSVYISHKNKTRNAFDREVSNVLDKYCLLYTSPSPRDRSLSRMPSSA